MSTVNSGPQMVRNGLVLDLDASYLRSYSPNVHPNPIDIFTWSGTGNNNCTLSGDTTITRRYGSIPLKMIMLGTDPYTGTYNSSSWNLAPAANGQTWTLSFYAKASETVTGNCYIFGANSSGNYIEAFATSFTVTTSWQRFTLTSTFSNASTAFIQIRFGGASGQVNKIIWWDGVQVERGSSATTFNPYYFGNAVWKDISGNNNNASLINGPLFDSGNKGNILFDGIDDYGSIANSSSLRPFAGLTIEMVIKAVSTTAAWNHLFGINPYTSYTPLIFLETGGQLIRALHFVDGVEYRCNTVESISTSVFKHVVFTFQPGDAIRSYFNGVASTTTSLPNGSLSYNTSNAFLIGYVGGNWPNIRYGLIRVYNRALVNAEISQNYQAIKSRFGL